MATDVPNPDPAGPVWRRPAVWRLLLVALFAEVGYAVMNISTMPIYLAADPGTPRWIAEGRGLGESVIGWIVVAFLLSEAVLKSPMGALADRIGPRKLMLIGPLITVFTSFLTILIPLNWGAAEVGLLILLRIGDGIGAAMLWPALFSRMGHVVDDDDRQSAMSLLNLCYLCGIAFALPIGGILNDLTGHRYSSLLLATVLFAAVSLNVWFGIPREEPHGDTSHVPEAKVAPGIEQAVDPTPHESPGLGEFLRSVREIPSYLVLAAVTFMGIGFPMVIVKNFALQEFGLSESAFGGLVLPGALGMAAFSAPLTKYGENIGRAKAVHTGLLLCAAGLAIVALGAFLPFLHTPWALALGGIPIGIGFLLTIPAWTASVSDIDPLRRGSNVGAVMTAQGLGAIVGAPIGAALYEKLRPIAGDTIAHYSPFFGCFLCVTAGWLLSLRLLPSRSPATSSPSS
jgi:DHA1 family multidrug resistance protein-like MFS transporter